jgi:hypothetical protein
MFGYDIRHKHLSMHNKHKCLGFNTMHLYFPQDSGHIMYKICTTLKKK